MKKKTWAMGYVAWRRIVAENGWSVAQLRGDERGDERLYDLQMEIGESMWTKYLQRYEGEAAD